MCRLGRASTTATITPFDLTSHPAFSANPCYLRNHHQPETPLVHAHTHAQHLFSAPILRSQANQSPALTIRRTLTQLYHYFFLKATLKKFDDEDRRLMGKWYKSYKPYPSAREQFPKHPDEVAGKLGSEKKKLEDFETLCKAECKEIMKKFKNFKTRTRAECDEIEKQRTKAWKSRDECEDIYKITKKLMRLDELEQEGSEKMLRTVMDERVIEVHRGCVFLVIHLLTLGLLRKEEADISKKLARPLRDLVDYRDT